MFAIKTTSQPLTTEDRLQELSRLFNWLSAEGQEDILLKTRVKAEREYRESLLAQCHKVLASYQYLLSSDDLFEVNVFITELAAKRYAEKQGR